MVLYSKFTDGSQISGKKTVCKYISWFTSYGNSCHTGEFRRFLWKTLYMQQTYMMLKTTIKVKVKDDFKDLLEFLNTHAALYISPTFMCLSPYPPVHFSIPLFAIPLVHFSVPPYALLHTSLCIFLSNPVRFSTPPPLCVSFYPPPRLNFSVPSLSFFFIIEL